MHSERVSRLTENQKKCLELVLLRNSSKEIALELKVSPHTVDQRLRIAIHTLGVTTRFEAARMLMEHQHGNTYQRDTYQASDIETTEQSAMILAVVKTEERQIGSDVSDDASEGMSDLESHSLNDPTKQMLKLPLFPKWRHPNDLGIMARLGLIMAIAAGVAIGFGTLLAGIEALIRISKVS